MFKNFFLARNNGDLTQVVLYFDSMGHMDVAYLLLNVYRLSEANNLWIYIGKG